MPSLSLTRDQLDALELDYPDDLTSAELVLGANPAAARHLHGTGLPCVLYLRTPTGTLGTGAHAGFVIELPLHQLQALGASEDDVFMAAGANVTDCMIDDEPTCGECAVHSDGERHPIDAETVQVCASCSTMIRESWDDARERSKAYETHEHLHLVWAERKP